MFSDMWVHKAELSDNNGQQNMFCIQLYMIMQQKKFPPIDEFPARLKNPINLPIHWYQQT